MEVSKASVLDSLTQGQLQELIELANAELERKNVALSADDSAPLAGRYRKKTFTKSTEIETGKFARLVQLSDGSYRLYWQHGDSSRPITMRKDESLARFGFYLCEQAAIETWGPSRVEVDGEALALFVRKVLDYAKNIVP